VNSAPSRISIPAIIAYAGIVVALLYLLGFQLSTDAPMYSRSIPPKALSSQTAIFNQIDSVVATAAAGQPVAYHVHASPAEWAEKYSSNFLTAFYSLVYTQYPNSVSVGDGSAIINFAADLHRADFVPTDAWLHDHGVATVVTLILGPSGPHLLIHRVP
jgi:hypothetical protein